MINAALMLAATMALQPVAPAAVPVPSHPSLLSRASGEAAAKANGNAGGPAVAAGGRHVAFYSTATNLHPADSDDASDVYVRNLSTNTTTLVSRGDGPGGVKGNGASYDASISADGRYVSFTSRSTNLDPDDRDAEADVYVRDLHTAETELVSRVRRHGSKANGLSRWGTISDNGRFVLYSSLATNLDRRDASTDLDVYRYDVRRGTTQLVSRSADGRKGNASSVGQSISADGRFVAFRSEATNLSVDDRTEDLDIYVRDMSSGLTILASRGPGRNGVKGNADSASGDLSADGRLLVFDSQANNLLPDDRDSVFDVYVRNLRTGEVGLVSRQGTGGPKGNGNSLSPSIGDNGRIISFQSSATNLVADDNDPVQDIYTRDVRRRMTLLVSQTNGQRGNADSRGADIAANQPVVAFQSTATNLDPADTDASPDVFASRVR